ncbi:hypothetical protein SKAU_G00114370 [Synaphobranchus kaupii]|uniref:Uncharacterized protein n=1 Tax=Synaphobranchus kaupii TaxID=118154 RepID=A0A9Q1G0T8_SYNKA|nr:hypothetical protein SKAU_G00114370 [Synaphobranchus kaupii]
MARRPKIKVRGAEARRVQEGPEERHEPKLESVFLLNVRFPPAEALAGHADLSGGLPRKGGLIRAPA